jgi:hypothetical protein
MGQIKASLTCAGIIQSSYPKSKVNSSVRMVF